MPPNKIANEEEKNYENIVGNVPGNHAVVNRSTGLYEI